MSEEKKDLTFLGLDLSLTDTGVVAVRGSEVFKHDIVTKPANFKHSLARVEKIADDVLGYVNTYLPELILIEDYFTNRNNPKAVIQLCELGTVVRYKLLKAGRGFWLVAPTQLKKFCTGKGNVGKDVILKDVYKKWGLDLNNNNIADASVLAFLARALYNKQNNIQQKLLKYEEVVIDDLIKYKTMIQ